jgi:hypothetical protein
MLQRRIDQGQIHQRGDPEQQFKWNSFHLFSRVKINDGDYNSKKKSVPDTETLFFIAQAEKTASYQFFFISAK